jgi:hypothetical protein
LPGWKERKGSSPVSRRRRRSDPDPDSDLA